MKHQIIKLGVIAVSFLAANMVYAEPLIGFGIK